VIVVEPDVINTNTEVLAGVDANQTCLLLGPNSDGVDHHVEIDGSNIQLTFIGAYYSPCTVIPVADYYYYNLGTLPEGEYTITFYRTPGGTLPVDPDDPNVIFEQFSDPITFGVSGIPVVPSMSVLGFFLMAITFVLVALYKIKKKRYLIVSVFLLFTFQVDAALYHVLLSGDPNAPTADEVQAESLISPPPPSPILGSFITARPAKVETLVSNRVTGHFLDLINNNPDWSYSKLYRYLVLTYPDGVDEQFIKNTLLADQFIDNVFLIEGDPSIVPLRTPSGNEINQKIKSNKKSQFSINSHLTDLDIISAWELSEGSGYIGAVDVGIQVDHPSFRAFDDSGNYLGGNLLEASYQYDNGEGDYNIDSAEP